MKFKILIIFILLISSRSFVRSQQLDWTDEQPRKIVYNNYYYQSNGDFFSYGSSNTPIVQSLVIAHYKNLIVETKRKISFEVDGQNAKFIGVCMLNDQLIVFLTLKNADSYHLYAQKVNNQCLYEGKAIKIAEYSTIGQSFGPMVSGPDLTNSTFRIQESENHKFFSIFYNIPEAGDGKQRFGAKVFDETMSVVSEGDYTSEYSGNEIELVKHYLSNSGKLYVGARIISKRALSDYVFYRCDNEKATAISVFSGVERVMNGENSIYESFLIGEDNEGRLGVVYLIENNQTKNEGVYFIKQDFDRKEVVSQSFFELPQSLQQSKSDVYRAKILGSEFTMDGGVVLLMNVLVNDDISLLKLNSDTVAWYKEIPLNYQNGPGGFFTMGLQDSSICLLFNDRIDAYNESGNYTGKSLDDEYWKYPACLVKLTVNVGDCSIVERKVLHEYERKGFMCNPLEFVWNQGANQVLLVTRLKMKEKYAVLDY